MNPEVVHGFLAQRVNAADVDGVVALFEPGAVLIDKDGNVIDGVESIESYLTDLLSIRPEMNLQLIRVIDTGNVAVLVSNWEMAGVGPDGGTISDRGRAFDILHYQVDGTWRIVVGNPWGKML